MRTPTRTPPWRRLPRRLHDQHVSALVVVSARTPCGATSGSRSACPCSSPICADHGRAVRVRATLHHEVFWDDVTALLNRVFAQKMRLVSEEQSNGKRVERRPDRGIGSSPVREGESNGKSQWRCCSVASNKPYDSKKKRCVKFRKLNQKQKQILMSNVSPS